MNVSHLSSAIQAFGPDADIETETYTVSFTVQVAYDKNQVSEDHFQRHDPVSAVEQVFDDIQTAVMAMQPGIFSCYGPLVVAEGTMHTKKED